MDTSAKYEEPTAWSLVRRKWFLLGTMILLPGTGLLSAQQSNVESDALPVFPVAGRVVNGLDGSPMAGVKVTLCREIAEGPGSTYVPKSVQVLTNNVGEFFFPVVTQGLNYIQAERKGYFDEWAVRRRAADSLGSFFIDGSTREVELRLLPTSSLSGTLLDEEGHPLANGPVSLNKTMVYGQGFTTTNYVDTTTTAQDGVFAFDGLFPGDYFLRTGTQPAAPAKGGESQTYPPAIWPASEPGLLSPRTVHLEPGTTKHATVRVNPRPLHHVEGHFTPAPVDWGDAFRTNVTADPEYGGSSYLQTASRENGAIDLLLPDGRYRIAVQTSTEQAGTLVEVKGGDLKDVSVELGSKVDVPVKIKISHAHKELLIPGLSVVQQATFSFRLTLADRHFGTDITMAGPARLPNAAGESSVTETNPGSYAVVTGSSPPWYIASITSDNHNLVDERLLVSDQEHTKPIEIERRGDGGTVTGVVQHDAVPSPAFVYALPTFASTGEMRTAATDAEGVYRLDGLAPGAYRLIALAHEEMIPFREDISGWLSRGRRATVAVDSEMKLNLDLEP